MRDFLHYSVPDSSNGLIIYYKQITEGYDDRNGLVSYGKSGDAKKCRTITRQVLMVFPPLGMAVIHRGGLSPTVQDDDGFRYDINAGLFAVFTILSVCIAIRPGYLLVYRLTAGTCLKSYRADFRRIQ